MVGSATQVILMYRLCILLGRALLSTISGSLV